MNIVLLLIAAAFICTVLSVLGHIPLWVAVLLLCVVALLIDRSW